MATFTDLVGGLAEQKRRARLAGRPITEAEVRGTTAGYFDVASERLARAKSLQQQKELAQAQLQQNQTLQSERLQSDAMLQAERLAEQKRAEQERIRMQEQQLSQQQETMEEQMRAAQEARKADERSSMIQTGIAGLAVAGEYGGSIVKGISSAFKAIGGGGK